MKKISFILLGFLCFSFLLIGLEKPTVMLQVNIKMKEVNVENLKSILRVGAEESFTKTGYRIINEENQRIALEEIKKQKKSDCLNDSCLIDTGGMLAAREIIKLEVKQIGEYYLFTVKQMDIETGSGVKTVSDFYRGNIDDMAKILDFTKKITSRVLGRKNLQLGRRLGQRSQNYDLLQEIFEYQSQKKEFLRKQKEKEKKFIKNLYKKYCSKLENKKCFQLAIKFESYNKVKYANQLYQDLCDKNYGKACNQLGYNYRYGVGLKQDPRRANAFYKKSCGLNYKESCYNYGDINYYQFNNKKEAYYGYRKACDLGLKNDICSIIE